MLKIITSIFFFLLFYCENLSAASFVKDSEIVVSIKPIHSVVSALTKGFANPVLLVNGDFSPHNFQLTPSQVMAIWIGPGYTTPLTTYFENFKGKVLCLQNSKNIKFLAMRTGIFWDESDSCCVHHDHESHGNKNNLDGHIWLDPNIMLQVVDVILEFLIIQYPNHKKLIESNAVAYRARIRSLYETLSKKMAPYKGQTYINQHDGSQYFDAVFGTKTIATISIDPSVPPGAGHMLKLRNAVSSGEINPKCLFTEIQTDSKLAASYADVIKIPFSSLDYLGLNIPAGEFAYEEIMTNYTDMLIRGLEAK